MRFIRVCFSENGLLPFCLRFRLFRDFRGFLSSFREQLRNTQCRKKNGFYDVESANGKEKVTVHGTEQVNRQ